MNGNERIEELVGYCPVGQPAHKVWEDAIVELAKRHAYAWKVLGVLQTEVARLRREVDQLKAKA